MPATSTQAPAFDLIGLVQRLSFARSLPEIQEIVRGGARRLTGAVGATFVRRDGDKCFYADDRIPHAAYEELEAARTETLHCLARAADYRDGATAEHTERVADRPPGSRPSSAAPPPRSS